MQNIQPVILAGGTGDRLWPLSRASYPKQVSSLLGEYSLLQSTLLRVKDHCLPPLIVTSEALRFIIQDQLDAIGMNDVTIICEPTPKNTLPAATLAALRYQHSSNTVLAILPADHYIQDSAAFIASLQQAATFAADGYITLLGITPNRAHTGYGYIQASANGKISEFKEKPDLQTAQRFINSGDYYWNSGMFVCSPQILLAQIKQYQPLIYNNAQHNFNHCPAESIDTGIMEKTDKGMLVAATFDWNDVGDWQALWDVCEKDAHGNVIKGEVITENCNNNYLRAEHRLVAAVDVDDLVVVETADAVLVSHKSAAQKVKKIVSKMKQDKREQATTHHRHNRPWGYFESIDSGDGFQVKHLMVKPGGQLSLQLHYHRAEHWIVVSGTAKVTCGNEIKQLGPNQSTYIPIETKHRLENPGTAPLHVVEVQSGNYLGEDDIVRFEDVYNREVLSESL